MSEQVPMWPGMPVMQFLAGCRLIFQRGVQEGIDLATAGGETWAWPPREEMVAEVLGYTINTPGYLKSLLIEAGLKPAEAGEEAGGELAGC